jgi:hypothetical protein
MEAAQNLDSESVSKLGQQAESAKIGPSTASQELTVYSHVSPNIRVATSSLFQFWGITIQFA